MASGSSRRRSAEADARKSELARQILGDERLIVAPTVGQRDAAEWLRGHDVVGLHEVEVVYCHRSGDGDYRARRPYCNGIVELDGRENDEYACPHCDRPIFPQLDSKRTFPAIRVAPRREGIEAAILSHLGESGTGLSFEGGLLHLAVGSLNAHLCICDFCEDSAWFSTNFACSQAVVYITISPVFELAIPKDPAIIRADLVSILSEGLDLQEALRKSLKPRTPAQPSASVWLSPRMLSRSAGNPRHPLRRRRFRMSVSSTEVRVEDLIVVHRQQGTKLAIMRIFAEDLRRAAANGGPAGLSPEMIATRVGSGVDPDSIRRSIDRVRDDIVHAVRRELGWPIDASDIVETVSRQGGRRSGEGYRLNPETVVLID